MRMLKSFIIVVLLYPISFIADGQTAKAWYKGNLHTHSYWSDGDEFPEMIMDWYKSHGYQFVGLSDHNILAAVEKWVKITRSNLYEEAFANYLNKYGATWVKYKKDSGRVSAQLKTLEEYRPLFEDRSFLILKSEEITSKLGEMHIHVNATNVQTVIGRQTGSTVAEIMQKSVDAVLAQRKATGIPMFPHINHPNFFYSITLQDLIDLRGEQFFEVYNGHPLVNNYGDSLHPGTEVMWDKINIAYRNRGQTLMYGLATDDSHNYHQFGSTYSNAGRGWVMVYADALTPASLIAALESGDFYASTGVTLESISVKATPASKSLELKVKQEEGVTYTIEFIGARKADKEAKVLQSIKGAQASFSFNNDYLFVRGRVTSSKLKPNPFQDKDVEMAWTQPVFQK